MSKLKQVFFELKVPVCIFYGLNLSCHFLLLTMYMRKYYFLILPFLIGSFLFGATSCQKDYSYEGGSFSSMALGSLTDSLGDCSKMSINGFYNADVAFTANNYITVEANINAAGNYNLFTDTVNGYYFKGSGSIGSVGIQSIKLLAYGKPLAAVPSLFTLHFISSICHFTILPDSAIFSLASNCGAAVVNGDYKTGVPLNAGDTVNITINVTGTGAYTIETPVVNGIGFSAKGVFNKIGSEVINFTGRGTPLTEGKTSIALNIGGASCSFTIPVSSVVINYPLFWKFTVDSTIHQQGILDSGRLSVTVNTNYPSNTVYAMQVYGAGGGPLLVPLTFQLNLARINHILSVGAYSPGTTGSKDFIGYVGHFDTTGNLSASNNLPAFFITVTTFDDLTRLVEGTFSGPVIDDFGKKHIITDGAFRTYFKY